uniref:ShKT domain-containing protein n=1 Tax=Panagrolaimus superbus TaxID=310955 RepID=A0A914Z8Z6_9BILA
MYYFLLTFLPLLIAAALLANFEVNAINDDKLNCTDKSPYCNKNDCITRPGYALEYCRKTCGNCQAFCQESQYVSCNISAKADCEFMLRDYCPIMCGICRPIKKKRPKATLSTTTLPTLSTLDDRNTSSTVTIDKSLSSSTKPKPLPQNNSLTFLESPFNDNNLIPPPALSTMPFESRNNFLNARRSDYHERPSRPRAYSVYNSGKPQQPNSSTEKVNIKAVPLITNFKNQIIIPPRIRKTQPQNARLSYAYNSIQPRQQQSYQAQFSYPQPLNQMTTLYPPYPVDYGDFGYFRITEPPAPPVVPQPITLLSSEPYQTAPLMAYPMPIQSSAPTSNYISPYNNNRNYVNQRRAQPATTRSPPFFADYDVIDTDAGNVQEPFYTEEITNPPPAMMTTEKPKMNNLKNAVAITDLVTLLGCRDRDPIVCSKVTEESCRARPGFYFKLCPVKCKNCNGLACADSNKIDCSDLQQRGGCRLPMAQEYCPKTCNTCPTPHFISEQQSICKDELETCDQLVESGVCEHPFSKPTMRLYCAKSCGFCKSSQYYMNDYFDIPKSFNIYPTTGTEF